MRWVLVAILFFAGAPASAQNVMDGSDDGIDRGLVVAAFRSITKKSRDPYSTQLDRLQVSRTHDGSRSLCGFVNRLDASGQYGGFTPFAYDEKNDKSSVASKGNRVPGELYLFQRVFGYAGCGHLLPKAPAATPTAPPNLVAALKGMATYDRAAAGYVTSSTNPAVLDYVICLEAEVAKQPGHDIVTRVGAATNKCAAVAAALPKDQPAEEIVMNILECGFGPGDASPDAGC